MLDDATEKTFAEMTSNDRVSWVVGRLTLAIGEGKFREGVAFIMMTFIQMGYEKGVTDERAGRSNVPKE